MTYFQVLVEYGFALGGARKIALSDNTEEDNRNFSDILTSRFCLFVLNMIVISVICLITGADTSDFRDIMILMLVVLSVVFQANWIFQGKQQMKFITIVNVIGRVLSVVLIFAFVNSPDQVWLYCLFYAVTFIFSSSVGLTIAVKRFNLSFKIAPLKRIITAIKENFPLFASVAISKLFGNVGITILGLYVIDEVVGGYSAVYKIPYIMTLCFSPIGQALYPYISKKYKTGEYKARKLLIKIGFCVLGALGVCGIIIITLYDAQQAVFDDGKKEFSGYNRKWEICNECSFRT